jgi:hypothetical protein
MFEGPLAAGSSRRGRIGRAYTQRANRRSSFVARGAVGGNVGSDRSLLAIAGGIAATVVVAVLIVVVLGDRPPAPFPQGTPEAALQGYVQAWEDEDLEATYGYFSQGVKATLPFEEYRQVARDQGNFSGVPQQRRVTIDKVELDGERAEVYLSIEYSFEGGFPLGGGYRDTRTIHLVKEAVDWKVDDALLGLEPGPFPSKGFEVAPPGSDVAPPGSGG